jgi:hypothetical protein
MVSLSFCPALPIFRRPPLGSRLSSPMPASPNYYLTSFPPVATNQL